MSTTASCEARDDALCALALGGLDGGERAELLAHVEGCSRCAGVLKHLSLVADSLLELAPAAEPPLGFEVRVLEEMRRLRPPRHRGRRVLIAVAALVLALAGFGIGNLTAQRPATAANPVALASFRSGTMNEGEALAYPGTPGRLLVTVDGVGYNGEVRCVVVTTAGKTLPVGNFWLANGYGWWGVNLPIDTDDLHSAELLGAGSHPQVVAEATFSPAD